MNGKLALGRKAKMSNRSKAENERSKNYDVKI